MHFYVQLDHLGAVLGGKVELVVASTSTLMTRQVSRCHRCACFAAAISLLLVNFQEGVIRLGTVPTAYQDHYSGPIASKQSSLVPVLCICAPWA